jgi:RNA polymerase sigma-70 factor (sigma-E family)
MDMGGPTAGPDSSATADLDQGAGSVGRLGELYRQHADAAVRLAWLLTGDPALAQDLVQDAFVKLAGRLAHIRNRDAFPAYLRTTVVNLARMQFRRRRRERASLERQAGLRGQVAVEPDLIESEVLRERLQHLTERQRAAVVLRFYEDLTDVQTARILGCAPGTVRSLVSRAMETLRQEGES